LTARAPCLLSRRTISSVMQTQGHERHADAPGVCDVFPQQIQLSRCRLGIIVLWQRLQASSRAPYYATYRLTALQQEQHSAMCCLQSCNIQLFCRSAFNDVRSSTPCHTRTEDSNHQESELALRGRSYLRHDQELTGLQDTSVRLLAHLARGTCSLCRASATEPLCRCNLSRGSMDCIGDRAVYIFWYRTHLLICTYGEGASQPAKTPSVPQSVKRHERTSLAAVGQVHACMRLQTQ